MIYWEGRDLTKPPYWENKIREYEIIARAGKRYIVVQFSEEQLPRLLFYCRVMEYMLGEK
jgi:hypothetical protein